MRHREMFFKAANDITLLVGSATAVTAPLCQEWLQQKPACPLTAAVGFGTETRARNRFDDRKGRECAVFVRPLVTGLVWRRTTLQNIARQ